jgi:hypothetical protein
VPNKEINTEKSCIVKTLEWIRRICGSMTNKMVIVKKITKEEKNIFIHSQKSKDKSDKCRRWCLAKIRANQSRAQEPRKENTEEHYYQIALVTVSISGNKNNTD